MRLALPLLLVSVVCCAHTVRADTFSHSRVPASAEGVVHIDLDAFRRSSLHRHLLGKLPGGSVKGLKKQLRDKMAAELGGGKAARANADKVAAAIVDLIDEATGITIWIDEREDGAVLVHSKTIPTLVDALAAATGATPETKQGVTYYRVEDACVATEGSTLILAEHSELVVRSARVLRGKDKAMPKKRLDVSSKRGGILFVAGFGGEIMDAIRKGAKAKALQADIRTLILHAGEDKGGFFFTARAETDSPKTAQRVSAILTGLMALGSLVDDQPELQALTSRTTVETKGNTVTATLEIPTKTLLSLIDQVD